MMQKFYLSCPCMWWHWWVVTNLEGGLGLGRGNMTELCCVIVVEMTVEEKPTNMC